MLRRKIRNRKNMTPGSGTRSVGKKELSFRRGWVLDGVGKESLHGEASAISPEGRRKVYDYLEDKTAVMGGLSSVEMGDKKIVGKFKVMQNWCG